ncbi:MAG: ribosome small subunit-dependent GTPase A [Gemmatimonadaceae bacterium]
MMRGVVLSGTGGSWRVHTGDGKVVSAVLRGRLKLAGRAVKLAVGDAVVLRPPPPQAKASESSHTIEEILPRRSTLSRRAPGAKVAERVVASNVDQVLVVFAAARPEPNERMLDRFLAIAEGSDLSASVIVNKMDLVDERAARERFALYERLGYTVFFTSCKRGDGLDEVGPALRDRTSVLSGPSGAGKSSLMNALYPGLDLRVAEISASVNKGRHTTVGAYVHPLPNGGYIVDTPGLREVGLWGLPATTLDNCFPEFRPYLGECRFTDCAHDTEPDCAIRAAVAKGDIDAGRYESYRRMRQELLETEKIY